MTTKLIRKSATAMAISACLLVGLISRAEASIRPAGDGYETSYRLNLEIPTPTGNDIQNAFIFEWNDSDFSLDHAGTIAGAGPTNLSHVIDFEPSSALVLGYIDAVPNFGDEKPHLYTVIGATHSKYIEENLLGVLFSKIYGINEQIVIEWLRQAAEGDQEALDNLKALVVDELSVAAFDPEGGFRIHKWSPAAVPVPEPSTILIFGTGLLGLAAVHLRRRRRKVKA
jgi:hypothetical protein